MIFIKKAFLQIWLIGLTLTNCRVSNKVYSDYFLPKSSVSNFKTLKRSI